jgi:DNA polymerase-1
MLQVEKELWRQRLEAKMILQVHDELVLEVPEEEVEEAKKLLKTSMENVIQLDVPLVVNLAISTNLSKI